MVPVWLDELDQRIERVDDGDLVISKGLDSGLAVGGVVVDDENAKRIGHENLPLRLLIECVRRYALHHLDKELYHNFFILSI